MPRVIAPEEFDLIRQAEDLGAAGLNGTAAADALDKALNSLRYVVEKHGFEMVPCFQIRAKLGGMQFSRAVECGDVERGEPQVSSPEPAATAA